MSRLIDRILQDCQIFRCSLIDPVAFNQLIKNNLYKTPEKQTTTEEWNILKQSIRAGEPVSIEEFDYTTLENILVFAADDIGLYTHSLPIGTNMVDVVSSMAPPFNKFFIEFQRVPNHLGLNAWGTLITVPENPDEMVIFEDVKEKPRWVLHFQTFLEREKRRPFGPVAHHYAGLAEDGTWYRHPNGELWWNGGFVELNKEPPDEVVKNWGDSIAQLLFPTLMTLSFLHCKNVKINPISPPKKLSRKYHKKHGRDLSHYKILDIEPMRKILDQYRTGSRDDLRRALHICRGHFKVFGPDAPLFGRHIGTYWWAPQVRGSKDSGTVLKDYRVHAPSDFGKVYREANEVPPHSLNEAPSSKDPDRAGRGLAAHNRTQNKIANIVNKLGWTPRSPAANEPDFDVAWKVKNELYVCEVKSLTSQNEERQLRMAIGQVIRYRQKLNAAGYEPVNAVVASEIQPEDKTWEELFATENILLIWPENAEDRLQEAIV